MSLSDHLKGSQFYHHMQKYLATECELEQNSYPRRHPLSHGKAVLVKADRRITSNFCAQPNHRLCSRCEKRYVIDGRGYQSTPESCVYHLKRLSRRDGVGMWYHPCCNKQKNGEGCSIFRCHVSMNIDPNNLVGFVETPTKIVENKQVYAVDCEMGYTTGGLELIKVTVVDSCKKVIYDSFVVPNNPIVDCNTAASGVKATDLTNVSVSLGDVQQHLLSLFSKNTILVGHSLDSDLIALKLIHSTVVDTSLVFKPTSGRPRKLALRHLAQEYLQKTIQNSATGHDSTEDAITCIELMHHKVKKDLKL